MHKLILLFSSEEASQTNPIWKAWWFQWCQALVHVAYHDALHHPGPFKAPCRSLFRAAGFHEIFTIKSRQPTSWRFLWFHAVLPEKVSSQYDASVWSWRDTVRDVEKVWAKPEKRRSKLNSYGIEYQLKAHTQIMLPWMNSQDILFTHQKCWPLLQRQ